MYASLMYSSLKISFVYYRLVIVVIEEPKASVFQFYTFMLFVQFYLPLPYMMIYIRLWVTHKTYTFHYTRKVLILSCKGF